MSIRILEKDLGQVFCDLIRSSESSIRIISPYIGKELVDLLCKTKRKQIECTLVTRFYREEFIAKASDLNALRVALDHSCDIYALQKLHTKLYLIDRKYALLGSANLTTGGFFLNHELTVLFENENQVIDVLQNYFSEMLNKIKESGDYKLSYEKIENEYALVKDILRSRKGGDGVRNETKFGAEIDEKQLSVHKAITINDGINDSIQTALRRNNEINDDIWLKIEGKSEYRKMKNDAYIVKHWDEFPTGITCFPTSKEPTGIKQGDRVYMSIVGTDNNDKETVVIMGRARSKGYTKGSIADEAMRKRFRMGEKWAAYMELYDFEYLNTTIGNGVSLFDMICVLGTDTYPSTLGTNKSTSEILKIHHQKSHLRLTSDAANYIDEHFELKAKEFGTLKY